MKSVILRVGGSRPPNSSAGVQFELQFPDVLQRLGYLIACLHGQAAVIGKTIELPDDLITFVFHLTPGLVWVTRSAVTHQACGMTLPADTLTSMITARVWSCSRKLSCLLSIWLKCQLS